MADSTKKLKELAKLVRYYALKMSTTAGSGHPTSSLSAADLMTALFETTFRYDFDNPQNPANDRLIFSKGHASPLYYSLFAVAGRLSEKDLEGYRKFSSNLEGHPTPRFPYTEAATGSLGQGLSIGLGLALAIKNQEFRIKNQEKNKDHDSLFMIHNSSPRVYVLLGDGEMAEGQVWEALEVASYYKVNNLIGILDVNRLGQSQETMLGHDVETYSERIKSFGWETIVIDGHDLDQITSAYKQATQSKDRSVMIIAKTIKGKGVSFIEDKNGWHGKALPKADFEKAVKELGPINFDLRFSAQKPAIHRHSDLASPEKNPVGNTEALRDPSGRIPQDDIYHIGEEIATRRAYGDALAKVGEQYPEIVALDAEVKNSTFSEIFKAKFPDRFYEMFIAEQNMVGVAVGFSKRNFIPFVSTFAAFFTRAFDQIRMGAISLANVKFVGSHAGISIGEDGPSQMGLEDLSMFRSIQGSRVVYPSDAVSTEKLVEEMVKTDGMVYMRTSRPNTPVIYGNDEKFPIGGSKVHKTSPPYQGGVPQSGRGGLRYRAIIIGAGITLHEALKAQKELGEKGIPTIVVDAYSIKPIDEKTIRSLLDQGPTLNPIIVVEDHWFDGGLGDAVINIFSQDTNKPRIIKLAVRDVPRSGKPAELLSWAGIDADSIVKTVEQNS